MPVHIDWEKNHARIIMSVDFRPRSNISREENGMCAGGLVWTLEITNTRLDWFFMEGVITNTPFDWLVKE